MTSADFTANIRRAGLRRWWKLVEPRPARAPGKSLIEKLGREHRPLRSARGTEHHREQRAAVAIGERHHIEAGGTDESRLHAHRAVIASDQPVGVLEDGIAELDRANAPIVPELRKIAVERKAENGEVAGGDLLARIMPAIGIGEDRFAHAEALRLPVHQHDEALCIAANRFADHISEVVGRFDEQDLQRIVDE